MGRIHHCNKGIMMNEKMYKLAIEAINNLIVADEVEDDLYADALMVKQFMVDTAVFLDSVGDDMAAMTSAYNSLHDRFLKASLNNIHAANDNR